MGRHLAAGNRGSRRNAAMPLRPRATCPPRCLLWWWTRCPRLALLRGQGKARRAHGAVEAAQVQRGTLAPGSPPGQSASAGSG